MIKKQLFIESAKKAKKEPYRCYDAIWNGFRFLTYWDELRGWFECVMMYSPDYAGKDYIYGCYIDELVGNVEKTMADAMKVYKNGGHYLHLL